MAWLRRAAILGCAVAVATVALTFGDPSPPEAKANIACDIGVAPAAPITGALGIGNPVGDACNAVTDPVLGVAGHVLDPLKEAAASLSKGVFDQITTWASDGAVWLLGEVVELTQKTTSPNLLSKGFLRQYRQMASIAVVLALLMLIFAAAWRAWAGAMARCCCGSSWSTCPSRRLRRAPPTSSYSFCRDDGWLLGSHRALDGERHPRLFQGRGRSAGGSWRGCRGDRRDRDRRGSSGRGDGRGGVSGGAAVRRLHRCDRRRLRGVPGLGRAADARRGDLRRRAVHADSPSLPRSGRDGCRRCGGPASW